MINLAKSRSTLTQQSKEAAKGQTIGRGLQSSQNIEEIEMRLRQSFDMETKYGPLSTLQE